MVLLFLGSVNPPHYCQSWDFFVGMRVNDGLQMLSICQRGLFLSCKVNWVEYAEEQTVKYRRNARVMKLIQNRIQKEKTVTNFWFCNSSWWATEDKSCTFCVGLLGGGVGLEQKWNLHSCGLFINVGSWNGPEFLLRLCVFIHWKYVWKASRHSSWFYIGYVLPCPLIVGVYWRRLLPLWSLFEHYQKEVLFSYFLDIKVLKKWSLKISFYYTFCFKKYLKQSGYFLY